MNHRPRLTLLDEDTHRTAKECLSRLRVDREFESVIVLLQHELAAERKLYEEQAASEYQRGQVQMLKKVLDLLEGQYHE